MVKTIKIFGDKYLIRKTYDIGDDGIGIYGFDVYGENQKLRSFIGEEIEELKQYIQIAFYKSYVCLIKQ